MSSAMPRSIGASMRGLVRLELDLLRRFPSLVAALLVAALIPALCAGIYLSSLWDPAAHTKALTVALVNEDQGVSAEGRRIVLGNDVVAALRAQASFGYQLWDDAESARHAVRIGEVVFAVLIPPEFSRQAVAGLQAGAGRIVIHASEGNNYAGAALARRFAPELAHDINQTLNEQRWASVLASAASSTDGVGELRHGVEAMASAAQRVTVSLAQAQGSVAALETGAGRLAQGGDRLRSGLQSLEPGARQLVNGLGQTGAVIRGLADRQPPAADLQRLKAGAQQLAAEQVALGQGLRQLRAGAGQLREGAGQLHDEAQAVPLIGGAIEAAAAALQAGAQRLDDGLGEASKVSDGLASGAARVSGGVQALADGSAQLGAALTQLAAALPEDAVGQALPAALHDAGQGSAELALGARRLGEGATQLAGGLTQLGAGSARVSDGLQALLGRLPASTLAIEGSPQGLSESVKPVVEIVAPVANQGSGFAPNFIPLALWVGATLCTFLFNFRALPAPLLGGAPLGLVLGKLALPALLVCAQTGVMLVMLFGLLGVQVDNGPRFVFALLLTALAFLALIFALVRLLGDAGKLVAFLLLVLQLAAAGATMPVELTTTFFQAIHPYLPMTWVVRMVRIAMFGAYEGDWVPSALVVGGVALVSLAGATTLGCWRPVALQDYKPPLDVG